MPLHFDPWWLPWQSPLKELQYLLPEGILVADEQGNVFLLPRHSLTAQTWIMQCLYRFLSVFHVLLMWFACLRNFSSELQQATFWKQIGSLHCTGMSFSGIVQCFQASTARVRRWNTIKYDLYDRTTCTTSTCIAIIAKLLLCAESSHSWLAATRTDSGLETHHAAAPEQRAPFGWGSKFSQTWRDLKGLAVRVEHLLQKGEPKGYEYSL